jgi:hypothetical protein
MKRQPIRLLVGILIGAALFFSVGEGRGANHQAIQAPPISLGTSGGNIGDHSRGYCCSGTLGALVQKGSTYYILSNNHVLARTNKGRVGEEISQPGLVDYNCGVYQIVAYLSDFVRISFASRRTNVADAAIAQINPGQVKIGGDILDVGQISGSTVLPTIGLAIQKSGRTTGRTLGTIAAIDATIHVRYFSRCGSRLGRTATFVNQIVIYDAAFSAAGDSGSLVLDQASPPNAVGLLFAGNATTTVCNPINDVLAALGVSLVGTASIPAGSTNLPEHAGAAEVAVARAVKARHEGAIFARHPAVCGVGVGRGAVERVVIQVYAERDLHSVRRAIPHMLDGVPVEVIETGEIVAY